MEFLDLFLILREGTARGDLGLRAVPFGLFFVWLLAIFVPHLAWVPRAQQTLDLGLGLLPGPGGCLGRCIGPK